MTGRSLWHILLLTVLIACYSCNWVGNNGLDNSETGIKKRSADSVFKRLVRQPYLYTAWQNIYRQKDTSFSIDSFTYRSQYTNDFIYTLANMQKDHFRKYHLLFTYNSDSSKYIDLFSTYININIDRAKRLHRGKMQSEQEVAVIDKRTQKRFRVFFCSNPCFVAYGAWIDDDDIALLGLTTELEEDGYIPTIWIINMKKNSTTEYSNPRAINSITPDMLLDEVLTSKGIRK
jgi:hypothetical protein